MLDHDAKFATKAVHAGQSPDAETGALVAPVFLTSTYTWTHEKMDRYLAGDKEGIFTYARSRNPTQNDLQDKIAALEGAEAALSTASGMAAISLALMNAAHAGDHIIAHRTLYGGTYALFTKIFEELHIEVTFVENLDHATLSAAKKENTKAIYAETIANPTMEVLDVAAFAAWAKENNVLSIVDSTFTSPYLLHPIEYGVDVVVHSTTKYINGHGDLIGGVIAGGFEFIDSIRASIYQELGPVPSPFSCFLQLRGLKTLHLRMRAHSENALRLAEWLQAQDGIDNVAYPGIPSFKSHQLAKAQFGGRGYGGMLSFEVEGGIPGGQAFIKRLQMTKYCVSLGDLDTLIQHPATMTHGKMPPEERARMGISDGMLRVSVGVEDIEDIIADFRRALEGKAHV